MTTQSDRYSIERLLGAGGMGQVYLAHDEQLDRPVALKLLRGASAETLERSVHEARLQAKVVHDHVCQVYEVGAMDGKPFIAMQFVDGMPLDHAAESMSLNDLVEVMRDVADAVQAAHVQGLVHRDLKPGNVMVCRMPSGHHHAYVLDFGIAVEHSAPEVTATGTVRGTPAYMAPEQIRGDTQLDGRTDVYSMGAMLYELVSGRRPFEGDSAVEVMFAALERHPPALRGLDRNLAVDLCAVIELCLEKQPDRRYRSARALAEDLERFLAGEPVVARPISRFDRAGRFLRRHRLPAAVIGLAVVIACTSAAIVLHTRWRAGEQARLAAQFGAKAMQVGDRFHMVVLAPNQDIAAARDKLQTQMEELAAEIRRRGTIARGPGHHALGEAALALGYVHQARDHFRTAIDEGYDHSSTWHGLGLALAEIYLDEWAKLRHMHQALRAPRLERIQREFRQPALDALNQAGPSDSFTRAMDAMLRAEWQEAATGFEAAFDSDSIRYDALFRAGDAMFEQGWQAYRDGNGELAADFLGDARQAYRRSQEIGRSDPRPWQAECQTAELRIELGRLNAEPDIGVEDLLAPCDRAVELDPRRAAILERRAGLYQGLAARAMRRGDDPTSFLEKAIADAERALVLDGDALNAHLYLGIARSLQASAVETTEQTREALISATEHLEACLRIDADFIPAHNSLSIVAMDRADLQMDLGEDPMASYSTAVDSLEAACRLATELPPLHNNLARARILRAKATVEKGEDPTDDLEAARESLARASEIAPGYASPYFNLGLSWWIEALWLMQGGGDPVGAIEYGDQAYVTLLENDPDYVWGRVDRADLHLDFAEFRLRSKADPQAELDRVREVLLSVDTADEEIFQCSEARLALLTARHLRGNGRGSKTMMDRARRIADRGQCRTVAAEVDLWTARWLAPSDPEAAKAIQAGLEKIADAIEDRPGNTDAWRLCGLLERELASTAIDSESRKQAAERAVEAFAEAERLSPGWAGLFRVEILGGEKSTLTS